jgi:hypothetical protein
MRRLAALLPAALAAAALTPGSAPAATLSYATAKGTADYFTQQSATYYSARAAADGCARTTLWRFGCRMALWVGTWYGTRSFDVVSPVLGTHLRTERWTAWVWARR